MIAKFAPIAGLLSLGLIGLWQIYEVGYDVGYSDLSKEHYENYQDQLEIAYERVETLQESLVALDQKATKEKLVLMADIDILEEKARDYESKQTVDDDACLNGEWLRVHNAAADLSKSTDTRPARLDDAPTRGVDKSEALAVIVKNYGQCALYIKQIEGLQAYIKEILRDGG